MLFLDLQLFSHSCKLNEISCRLLPVCSERVIGRRRESAVRVCNLL